ncbi:hypothetical protein GCM10027515_30440 [Schumannella luteola]|uniref:DUF3263 domain-containing protein n=1 Tax=Schumannella luteola TaxID=472059 RepID=A0A852YPN1_9MICO|nr:DUF3263 domain-containing protein [Schumannella luteola]NYG99155.1 hypothetical protein [Schumannella luteola]TPX02352.1 DUF3263 domain-containing protein [Schumannella luteola]
MIPSPSPEPAASPSDAAGAAAAESTRATAPAGAAVMGLTDAERRVLDFERDWIGRGGAKEAAIRSELGLTSARYHQLLHSAIDRPDALAADPLLVRRLQRLRTARTRARAARTFRIDPTDS